MIIWNPQIQTKPLTILIIKLVNGMELRDRDKGKHEQLVYEDIEFGEKIAEGSYGTVWKGILTSSYHTITLYQPNII
jgi:hypothetical protein